MTSCYKGCYFDKIHNKWKASIRHNGKNKTLGYFDNEKDAARCYNETAENEFGEFAKLNDVSDDEDENVDEE